VNESAAGGIERGNAVEGGNPHQMNGISSNRRKRGLENDVDEPERSSCQALEDVSVSSNDEDNTADGIRINEVNEEAEGHPPEAEEEEHDGDISTLDIQIKRAKLTYYNCQVRREEQKICDN
jgi:hypothetical protein